jgi:hypothetical protein
MAQVFRPISNLMAKAAILGILVFVGGSFVVLDALHKSDYVRQRGIAIEQPVPFSHKHHANLGIDCRYCHTSVETSSFANVPPTRTCMNCHNIMWNEAPMLEAVRQSWAKKEPLEWYRVHDLPDFVYFNHSAHLNAGIGCATCHGRVDQMPLTWKQEPLYMQWCLECHRDPTPFIRPKDKITDMAFDPLSLTQEQRTELVKYHGVDHANHRLTNCAICHR